MSDENLFSPPALQVKVKRLHPNATLPRYATPGAACFDLHSLNGGAIQPGAALVVSTGLAFELPAGHVMLVYSRSGHGYKKGVRLVNSVGVIDSDYRGEVFAGLRNEGSELFIYRAGDRIAQAMILPLPAVELAEADDLSETERGDGGLGSTGA